MNQPANQVETTDPMQPLVNEYQLWLDANPTLPRECAEELILCDLTFEQRRWLSDYVTRWDAAIAALN